MDNPFQFADVCNQYVERTGYNVSQLARLSGIPQRTVANWLAGHVKQPRELNDLLDLAKVLQLNEAEVTHLLQAAGYPALEELMRGNHEGHDKRKLTPWIAHVQQRKGAPFQVIPDLPYFIGREAEVEALTQTLLAGGPVTICSLQGMGGVGKTALAAHLAYRLRPHFPDGVLWARLGTSDTMTILSTFAGAYGRDVSRYGDLDSRSRVVRELLASKKVMIILDNASSSQEINPLLPPTTGTCAVIITTRHHDLFACVGAHRFEIGPFSGENQEALHLFAKLLGEERTAEEKSLLIKISKLVGHLPLALAITANRLACEPGWQTENYLKRLRQEKKRLNELVSEEQSVRLSFNLSYQILSPDEQRFFAALAVFGGDDFSVDAVATVTRLSTEETLDHLRTLHNLSLLQPGQTGRYRLHALLRDYAREQLDEQDNQVWSRMIRFFVDFIQANERNYEALDLEHGNILAAFKTAFLLATASERGLEPTLIKGINACYHYWETRGLYALARRHLEWAEQQARALNDTLLLATTLLNLGQLAQNLGQYEEAKATLQEALALAHQFKYSHLVMLLLKSLGMAAYKLGDYVQAEANLLESLRMAQEADNEAVTVTILMSLGVLAEKGGQFIQAETYLLRGLDLASHSGDHERICSLRMNLAAIVHASGNWDQATAHLEEALKLAREIGHRERISLILTNLGAMASTARKYEQAKAYLQEGLELAYKIGHQERTAGLLLNLGIVAHNLADYAQATDYCANALALARQLGHRWLEIVIHCKWGELYFEQEDLGAAAAAFEAALVLGRELGVLEYVAIALYGLARVAATHGRNDKAYHQGQESLSLFKTMGHHKVAEVESWLAALE